jgi:hypothetical protein
MDDVAVESALRNSNETYVNEYFKRKGLDGSQDYDV